MSLWCCRCHVGMLPCHQIALMALAAKVLLSSRGFRAKSNGPNMGHLTVPQYPKYPIQISDSSQHVIVHSGMYRNKARFHCTPLMSWGFQHVTTGTHIFICFHMFSYVFRFFRRSKKVHVTFWRHSGGDQSWPSTRALGGQEESLRRPSLAAQALGFSLICRKHQTSSDFWHFDDTVITYVKFITS